MWCGGLWTQSMNREKNCAQWCVCGGFGWEDEDEMRII